MQYKFYIILHKQTDNLTTEQKQITAKRSYLSNSKQKAKVKNFPKI